MIQSLSTVQHFLECGDFAVQAEMVAVDDYIDGRNTMNKFIDGLSHILRHDASGYFNKLMAQPEEHWTKTNNRKL